MASTMASLLHVLVEIPMEVPGVHQGPHNVELAKTPSQTRAPSSGSGTTVHIACRSRFLSPPGAPFSAPVALVIPRSGLSSEASQSQAPNPRGDYSLRRFFGWQRWRQPFPFLVSTADCRISRRLGSQSQRLLIPCCNSQACSRTDHVITRD